MVRSILTSLHTYLMCDMQSECYESIFVFLDSTTLIKSHLHSFVLIRKKSLLPRLEPSATSRRFPSTSPTVTALSHPTTCSKDKRVIYTGHAQDDICKVIVQRCDLQRTARRNTLFRPLLTPGMSI